MATASPNEELIELLGALCNDSITVEGEERLGSLLDNDCDARQLYVRYLDLHLSLTDLDLVAHVDSDDVLPGLLAGLDSCECDDLSSFDVSSDEQRQPPTAPGFLVPPLHGTVGYFSSGWPVAYLVATVIFGLGLLVGSRIYVSQPVQTARQSAASPSPSSTIHYPPSTIHSTVGHITGMVDCQWAEVGWVKRSAAPPEGGRQGESGSGTGNPQSLIPNSQSLVSLGDKFALASGLLEITYDTGAKVILQGPVTYKVESPAGGYLSVGKLTARLEKKNHLPSPSGRGAGGEGYTNSPRPSDGGHHEVVGAGGEGGSNSQSPIPNPLFSVRTPTATVTDLGTEFGVEVSKSGDTTSHVYRGVVELRVNDVQGGDQHPIRLTENQSASVKAQGGQPVAVLHEGGTAEVFVRELPRRVPITLFNTGSGAAEGQPDPHWQLIAVSNDPNFKPRPAVVTKAVDGAWMLNDPERSQWISAAGDASPLLYHVTYTFRTSFELSDVRPETARLHGAFVVNNHVRAIRINGRSAPVAGHGYGRSSSQLYHSFNVGSGFVAGTNVLEIDVENGQASAPTSDHVGAAMAGDVLFHDDFESTSSVSAAPYPDNGGNYDPTGGRPGSWTIVEGSPAEVQVTNSKTSPDPGPAQGRNYLRIRRTASGGASAIADCDVQASGDIHISQMLYVSSATDANPAQIVGLDMTGISEPPRFNIATNVYGASPGSLWTQADLGGGDFAFKQILGLTYTAGKWQKWEIDYNPASPLFNLTIDGATVKDIVGRSNGRLARLMFSQDSCSGAMYVDAVSVQAASGRLGLRVELEGTVQQR